MFMLKVFLGSKYIFYFFSIVIPVVLVSFYSFESKSDTLNGTLDTKIVINDHEDSTLKDKELIPINND